MKKPKHLYHVYIMTNRWHTVLYTGMTGWGLLRIWQHIEKIKPGFTKRYNINKLVYLEEFTEVTQAIAREKQIKRWSRKKKEWLIEKQNPNWEDLFVKYTTRKKDNNDEYSYPGGVTVNPVQYESGYAAHLY